MLFAVTIFTQNCKSQTPRFDTWEWTMLTELIEENNTEAFLETLMRDPSLATKIKSNRNHLFNKIEKSRIYEESKSTFHAIIFWVAKLAMILEFSEENQRNSHRFSKIVKKYYKTIEDEDFSFENLIKLLTVNSRGQNCSTTARFIELYNESENKNFYIKKMYQYKFHEITKALRSNNYVKLEIIIAGIPELVLIKAGRTSLIDQIKHFVADDEVKEEMIQLVEETRSFINDGRTGAWRGLSFRMHFSN